MTRFAFLVALVSLAAPALQAGSKDAELTPAEREKLVRILEDGRNRLLTAVAALDDDGWNYKPAADRWSAADITEHLYKSEGIFQSTFDQFLKAEGTSEWKAETAAKSDFLEKAMLDRSAALEVDDA